MSRDLFGMVQTAIKLQEARDTLRSLYRDEYPAKIKPWRAVVRGVADGKHKGNPLAAAIEICGDPKIKGDGYAVIFVLAAACDESERPAAGAEGDGDAT